MMNPASPPEVDLADLGFEQGAHLLVKRAARDLNPGDRLAVRGSDPHLQVHGGAWCRSQGHGWEPAGAPDGESGSPLAGWLIVGWPVTQRWKSSEWAGASNPQAPGAVADHPPAHWGLAARGARVEAGGPLFDFSLDSKDLVWTDEAHRLYEQAAAAQWDPGAAIPWNAEFTLPGEVEDAVVQVMTYLIENETAALLVPARFLARLHPHFREVMQLVAIQAADEARHIEVFTRRAALKRQRLGLSTVGGQASLKTLLDEPDFALAAFLLSVLGEGSFLNLLWFLHEHAPDPISAEVARLTAQDEARHVAFGLSHLGRHAGRDPALRGRLAESIHRRHESLRHTAGLNQEVFDALLLLAAGGWEPEALRLGHARVLQLERDMDSGRRRRLQLLGFSPDEAEALSALHTRNFM